MQGAGEPTDIHPASARGVYLWEETVERTDEFEFRVPLPRPTFLCTEERRAAAAAGASAQTSTRQCNRSFQRV